MEKYIEIYSFEAIGKVVEGEKVYMLDKKNHCVFFVNEMFMMDIAEVLRSEKPETRFMFWYTKEVDENGTV